MVKKKKPRQPYVLSKAKWQEILAEIMEGQSLNSICKREGMPKAATVYKALAKDPEKQKEYTLACDIRLETRLDEIIDIADDGSNDWMERKTKSGDVITVVDHEHVTRSKLRIEARQWEAAKLKPKKYGVPAQMVLVKDADEEGGPAKPRSTEEIKAAIIELMAQSKAKKDK
nr:terminase small subunit protein [uncultured Cohaesibacter sp.]